MNKEFIEIARNGLIKRIENRIEELIETDVFAERDTIISLTKREVEEALIAIFWLNTLQ